MLQDDAPETGLADGIPLWLHAAWQEPVCVRAPLVWGFLPFQLHSIVMHCSCACYGAQIDKKHSASRKKKVYDLNETTGYLNNYGLKTAGSLAVEQVDVSM